MRTLLLISAAVLFVNLLATQQKEARLNDAVGQVFFLDFSASPDKYWEYFFIKCIAVKNFKPDEVTIV